MKDKNLWMENSSLLHPNTLLAQVLHERAIFSLCIIYTVVSVHQKYYK